MPKLAISVKWLSLYPFLSHIEKEFANPKQLSKKFDIPLRTVYHYINQNKNGIRKMKRGRATFFHIEDFAQNCNLDITDMTEPQTPEETRPEKQDNPDLQNRVQNLQNQKSLFEEQVNNLQKVNNNMTDQLNKYALLLSEEKSEKKDLLEKYDRLQTTYQQKIEQFARKYYLLLGVCVALLLLLVAQYAPSLRGLLGIG